MKSVETKGNSDILSDVPGAFVCCLHTVQISDIIAVQCKNDEPAPGIDVLCPRFKNILKDLDRGSMNWQQYDDTDFSLVPMSSCTPLLMDEVRPMTEGGSDSSNLEMCLRKISKAISATKGEQANAAPNLVVRKWREYVCRDDVSQAIRNHPTKRFMLHLTFHWFFENMRTVVPWRRAKM
eukprot:Gregarina_sp_Poly_1__3789@NODE_2126_length_2633_cov_178_090413_g1369_i0_p2_GENE_NODE_2126_length_2633_cov_178_090413_g1369_i0NODE_2126_length_2633_cov_178_090413_g1369_i0_p2_ORF_typecomplete_len180_score13_29_NODE_2126_length_2633_cov_178_090413_g1369_i012571796